MDYEAIIRRAIDAIWNRGELPVADELFDPTYVNHDGLIPDLVHGPEAIKISVALFRTAFPNLHVAIEDLRTEGDIVVISWRARRDQPSPSPTDATSVDLTLMTGITRSRVARGKIVESWTQWAAPRPSSP
jgi:predicted SnoaL-like aldol condensation-catalyzing enzyme